MPNPDALYAITWGRLRLWAEVAETDNSRTLVIHELSSGDDHPVQDRGLVARSVRLQLLFDDDLAGETTSGIARFRALKAQVDSGAEEMFTHPIEGSFIAKVGEFTYKLDAEQSTVTDCAIQFVRSSAVEPVRFAGAGTSASAGQDAVVARAAELNAALDDVGIASDVADKAVAKQDAWIESADLDDPPTMGRVASDAADTSNDLGELITGEGLEEDLALWSAYKATIMLGDAFLASARAITAEAADTFVIQVLVPISVLSLAVRVYGGADAIDRERQIRRLNDMQTPAGMLRPGPVIMPGRATGHEAF